MGRRVLPNLLTRELFSKVDFYKYANNEEDTRRDYWWRNRARVKSNNGASRPEQSHEHWNRSYVSNRIKTNRYTWWNFLPVALFLQFTKVVNCFYFVQMIMQFFPDIRTNKPEFVATVLATLIFIGVVKEGLADWKRYKTDRASNAQPTQLVTGELLEKPTFNYQQ